MQSSPSPAPARVPAAPPPPPVAAEATPDAGLRAELDALNLGLRELKSTDHGVRAYVEMWLGFVAASVGGKLLHDSLSTRSKIAWAVWPLLLLGIAFLLDAASHKLTQYRLAADENRRLARQRELRGLLGLDDAPVPSLAPHANA